MIVQIPKIHNLTYDWKEKLGKSPATRGCAIQRYHPESAIWLDYSAFSRYPSEALEYALFHELAHWFFGFMGPVSEIAEDYNSSSKDEDAANRFALTLTSALHYPVLNLEKIKEARLLLPEGYRNGNALLHA
jgi:hypothetical protein